MKLTCTCIAALCILNAQPCHSENLGSGMGIEFLPKNLPAPSGKATTDDELRARLAKEKFAGTQEAGFRPDHHSPEKFSNFLLLEGKTCILPINSVLHIPENIEASLETSIVGQAITPSELLSSQRSKVGTLEVTIDEAVGKKAIDPGKITKVLESKSIIIATLSGSPISSPAVKAAILEVQNTKS